MLRQTLRCPTCRTVYANEPLLALLSVLIRSDSLQASGFISRAALSKELQEQKSQYCAVVDYDDPVNVSVYKIAQAICSRGTDHLPIAVCIESGAQDTPQSVIDNILSF